MAPQSSLHDLDRALDAVTLADLAAFETAHGLAESWVESNVVAVPEPSAVVLAGLGLAGLVAARRRRPRRAGGSGENA